MTIEQQAKERCKKLMDDYCETTTFWLDGYNYALQLAENRGKFIDWLLEHYPEVIQEYLK